MVGRRGETYLRETIVRYQFSSLPHFFQHFSACRSRGQEGTSIYRDVDTWFRALLLTPPHIFSKSLEPWYFLMSRISWTWQNSISRSFPTTLLVQRCVEGTAMARHQRHTSVSQGRAFGERLAACFKVRRVPEKCGKRESKIEMLLRRRLSIGNCQLDLQKVAFGILDKQRRSNPVWKTFFKTW